MPKKIVWKEPGQGRTPRNRTRNRPPYPPRFGPRDLHRRRRR